MDLEEHEILLNDLVLVLTTSTAAPRRATSCSNNNNKFRSLDHHHHVDETTTTLICDINRALYWSASVRASNVGQQLLRYGNGLQEHQLDALIDHVETCIRRSTLTIITTSRIFLR